MFRKSLLLVILFGLGFVFGLKADKFGFNSLGIKKGLDNEITSMKNSIVVFGESFSDGGLFGEIFGTIVIFIGSYAEWLFLFYVILVVIRMIIIYLR